MQERKAYWDADSFILLLIIGTMLLGAFAYAKLDNRLNALEKRMTLPTDGLHEEFQRLISGELSLDKASEGVKEWIDWHRRICEDDGCGYKPGEEAQLIQNAFEAYDDAGSR